MNSVRNHYGLPCVVSINRFNFDTAAEIELLKKKMAHHEAPVILATHWADGGKGAEEVARAVVELIEKVPSDFKYVYEDALPLWDKIKAIATKIYGAKDVTADAKIRGQIKKLQEDGYELPGVRRGNAVLVFDRRATARRALEHMINIREEYRLAAGAEFIVMVCGDVADHAGPAQGAVGGEDRSRRRRQGRRAVLGENAGRPDAHRGVREI